MVFRKMKQKEGVALGLVGFRPVSTGSQQMLKDREVKLPGKDKGCCPDGPSVGLELGSPRLMKRTRI